MDKKEIYSYLNEKKIWHEITEHKAVYNMADLADVEIPYLEGDAKNIFIRDDKKKNFYLITLKTFRTVYETRPLSFVSENDMVKMIGLHPGSVTPLGILNDEERIIKVYIDKCLLDGQGIIGVHPNDNTATVWIKTNDLIEIIKEHGNEVYLMENM